MSFDVLALVIAAAFAHAGWNLVAKGAQGGAAFVWWCVVAGTVLYVPILAFFVATDPGPLGWTAVALMAGQTWARVVAVILVIISAIGQLLLIPAQPWWSIIVIAIEILVIYALIVHGRELREDS